jgi:hypothetical protein
LSTMAKSNGESVVVLIGGEKRDAYFGDGTVERRKRGGFVREVFRRLRCRSDGEDNQGEQDRANRAMRKHWVPFPSSADEGALPNYGGDS